MTIVAGHLVLAPATLAVAIVLAAAGRAIRWRPWWLLCPAAAGLAWVLATGPGAALARFTAWPSGILGPLIAGHRTVHPGQPFAAFHIAWSALPGQLPVALICGAAEAAVFGWLDWLHTDEWAVPPPRAGLLAAVRGRLACAAIRAGAVLTRDGCALGVAQDTGAIAELRWAELAGGLLIAGDDSRDVTLASLQVVHAALRRRKPLIVFDHGDESAIGRALTAACLATGTPLRKNGSAAGLAGTQDGARSAAAGRAAPRRGAGDGARGADRPEIASGTGGASASGLWGRARGGLAESSPGVRRADGAVVDQHEVIMERSAALLPADSAAAASRACADVAALAQHLGAIGVDGDGLVWIPRGDLVSPADLAALLRDAPAAGLPVLIGATSPAAAADLAGLVGAVLTLRVTDSGLASRLADLTGVLILPAPAGLPAMPAVPPPPPAPLRGAAGVQPTVPAPPPMPAVPGLTAMPGADLVHRPVVSPRTLQTLRRGEFVLAVNVPRRRLIAPGQLIPARLPRAAEPSYQRKPPHRKATRHREAPRREETPRREEPRYSEEPPRRGEPPYREEPPFLRAPEVGGR